PDGPNKHWFQGLKRPDNAKHPYRDDKSLFCCGVADTVKTKFKVEPGDERYPEDRWYAWIKDEWRNAERKGRYRDIRPALLTCPGRQWLGLFPSLAATNKSLAQINKTPDHWRRYDERLGLTAC